MSDFDYDFFVVGGGSGGVRAARIAGANGGAARIVSDADKGCDSRLSLGRAGYRMGLYSALSSVQCGLAPGGHCLMVLTLRCLSTATIRCM